jgi:transcriptional regulator with XRE-family HTH domain
MTTTAGPGQFALLLQQYRAAAGLSQEELAEKARLSRRGISDLERGRRRSPHPATVRRLADGLGLNASDYRALLACAHPKAAADATDAPNLATSPVPPSDPIGRDSEISFGRWLLQHPRALDLTQSELANRVGYAAVTIHKIETDRLRPSRATAHKLADAFAIALTERERHSYVSREEIRAPTCPACP